MRAIKMDCPVCDREMYLDLNENFDELMDRIERKLILEAYEQHHHNQSAMARTLKIPAWSVRYYLQKHGVLPPKSTKKS